MKTYEITYSKDSFFVIPTDCIFVTDAQDEAGAISALRLNHPGAYVESIRTI